MVSRKAQSKAGISDKRRGQQMGDERSGKRSGPEEAEETTPALSGRRKEASRYFGDESSQQVASGGDGPSDNSPSLSGAIPTGEALGQSGGEKEFKERQKVKSKRQK